MQTIEIENLVLHQNGIKINRNGAGKNKKLENFQSDIFWLYERENLKKGNNYKLIMHITFPIAKSNKKKDKYKGAYVGKRPDLDNIPKSIIDAICKREEFEDSQFTEMELSKKYTTNLNDDNYHIFIDFEDLGERVD